MKSGLFFMPSHPPERSLWDGHQYDLQVLRWADDLGFDEAWIGEHHTAIWEPDPAPDLLIAQAFLQTKRIRLGTGGFLLPYHHPAELANRAAKLDHLGQGRYMLGIAASGLDSDFALFNVDGANGVNRQMTRESLEIMIKLWTEQEPFDYQGRFWHVTRTGPMHSSLGPHIVPFQKPHPPISVSGVSPNSETLKIAGERGFYAMTPGLNSLVVKSQWDSVQEGARRSGRTADRNNWRIVRDILVTPTDDVAWDLTVRSHMGRMWNDYFLDLWASGDFTKYLKPDPDVPDSAVDVEFCARNNWMIGSPDTVARKLEALYHEVGGFGTVLVMVYDYADDPHIWETSMRLFAQEVMPRLAHLDPTPAVAVAG